MPRAGRKGQRRQYLAFWGVSPVNATETKAEPLSRCRKEPLGFCSPSPATARGERPRQRPAQLGHEPARVPRARAQPRRPPRQPPQPRSSADTPAASPPAPPQPPAEPSQGAGSPGRAAGRGTSPAGSHPAAAPRRALPSAASRGGGGGSVPGVGRVPAGCGGGPVGAGCAAATPGAPGSGGRPGCGAGEAGGWRAERAGAQPPPAPLSRCPAPRPGTHRYPPSGDTPRGAAGVPTLPVPPRRVTETKRENVTEQNECRRRPPAATPGTVPPDRPRASRGDNKTQTLPSLTARSRGDGCHPWCTSPTERRASSTVSSLFHLTQTQPQVQLASFLKSIHLPTNPSG